MEKRKLSNIVGGERTALALTSFLRDVESAESVGVLVGLLRFWLVGSPGDVEEGVGASRLGVLSRGRPAAGRGLPADLWWRLGLGEARLGAVPGSGLPVELLLLLLAAVADGAAAGDAGGLRARGGAAARRRRGLHRRRQRLHTRGGRRAYRLRALRACVRSHGRGGTGLGAARPRPAGRRTCCIADYKITALLNVTNLLHYK